MHYTLMGKMRLPFIDSGLLYRGALYSHGLLYRGALYGSFDCTFKAPSFIDHI
jgi:hypothetical protein